jgi:Fe2+ transport system protein B
MIALLLLAGGACIFIAALVAFFVWKSKTGTTSTTTVKTSLKEEISDVTAIVKGEKAADVISSGYFSGVYPGVQVVTSRASLPKSTPAFLLLTDASGTITGVEANSVAWNSPDTAAAAPVVTIKPTTKPTAKPRKQK